MARSTGKKTTGSRKARSGGVFEELPRRVEEVRERAQEALDRAFDRVLEVLPAEQRKALRRLRRRADGIRDRAEDLLERAWERGLELVPAEQRKALADARRQLRSALRELDERRAELLDSARRRQEELARRIGESRQRVVTPVLARLEIASRADLARIEQRLARIEKQLAARAGRPRNKEKAAA